MKVHMVAAAGAAIVIIIAVLAMGGTSYLNPQSATGVKMTACDYDANGSVVGSCSNAFAVPVGQSIASLGGSPVSKIGISKAFVLLNYTGSPSSGSFTAMERVDYAKGVSDSYPISVSIPSGSTPCGTAICNIQKNFSLTLPVSSWSSSLLQSKWGSSYGPQVVNVTVANSVVNLVFPVGISPPAKPSAFNFVAQFKLNYLPTVTTTTSTTTTPSSTSTASTTTTTSAPTYGNGVTGGSVSTGTVNVWPDATRQITGGQTGNAAPTGVLVAVQPGSQSQVTVFLPANLLTKQCAAGCPISISLLTKVTSVTNSLPASASNLGSAQDFAIGHWISWSFLASTSQGDTVVVQVNLGSAQIFNQAVIADGSTTSITYTDLQGRSVTTPILTAIAPQYQAWVTSYVAYQTAQTAAANAALPDWCRPGPTYNRVNCQASMSVVSVSF